MITQKTINEIFETAKIDEVVGDFVNLKRRGVNMIGLCPFHNEKSPSFTVSPSKGIYKCFGCGKGGNSVNFVMEHEQFSYPEALRYLAKKYAIAIEEKEVSPEQDLERQRQDSFFIITEFAAKYFQHNILQTDIGKSIGLSYFKERGFREAVIQKFQLGYATAKSDALTLEMVSKGYKIELLQALGLTTATGRDFFRDRVQFPIHNLSGKVVGFGGRILTADKKQPKYLNSPETEIYNKSKVLYGIFFAKNAIRQLDNCFLVEGYTDVISLHQAGIENVVASSGTSLTVGQIQLIKRFTPNITILYDGDAAGIKAASRGLDLVLEQDMNVKIVLLPEGEDPDSFVQSAGTEAFKQYVTERAQDFILFKTNLILKETANDPIKRATLIKDIVGSIARIPDPIKRSVFVRTCSSLLEIGEQVLVDELNKAMLLHLKTQKQQRENEERQRERQILPPPRQQAAPPSQNFEEDPFAGLSPPDENSFEDYASPEEAFDLPEGVRFSPPPPVSVSPPPRFNEEFQEKDIVRILMLFGDQTFQLENKKTKTMENWSVAVYLLSNMEELMDEFDHPLYKRIVHLLYEDVAKSKVWTLQDFLRHEDEAIKQLAINVSTSPHEYSKNWIDRLDKPLATQPEPDLNFKRDAILATNQFKLKKIQRLYEKNQQRLKNIRNDEVETMMKLLKVQKRLAEIRAEIALLTGTVVLR